MTTTANIFPSTPARIAVNGQYALIVIPLPPITTCSNVSIVTNIANQEQIMSTMKYGIINITVRRATIAIRADVVIRESADEMLQ